MSRDMTIRVREEFPRLATIPMIGSQPHSSLTSLSRLLARHAAAEFLAGQIPTFLIEGQRA